MKYYHDGGYQPKDKLDTSKPPKGGSGVVYSKHAQCCCYKACQKKYCCCRCHPSTNILP